MARNQFRNSRGEIMTIEIDKAACTGHIELERLPGQRIPIALDNLSGYIRLDEDEMDELVFAWALGAGMPRDEVIRLDRRQRERKEQGMQECEDGIHSWIDEVGLLPPDTACTRCGDTYGHPD